MKMVSVKVNLPNIEFFKQAQIIPLVLSSSPNQNFRKISLELHVL